eukprot:7397468-Pyramimonas_sp.AAC.1
MVGPTDSPLALLTASYIVIYLLTGVGRQQVVELALRRLGLFGRVLNQNLGGTNEGNQDLACRLTLDATSPGVDCRPANDSPPTGNIRRIFYGIFEMSCAEWYTSVDSQRLST